MPQLFVTGLDGCSARLRQRLSAWPALGIAWLVADFGSGGRGKSDFDVTPLHERVHYDCVVFGFVRFRPRLWTGQTLREVRTRAGTC